VADHFLETHFPGCERSSDENSTTLETTSLPTEANWLEAFGIISEDKIRWAIAGFGPFKTAGEDGIFSALLKNGIEVLINSLRKIFIACLAFSYIPKPWWKVKVIFIPKPGRDSYDFTLPKYSVSCFFQACHTEGAKSYYDFMIFAPYEIHAISCHLLQKIMTFHDFF
jgi:hypothetical protein